MKNILTLDQIYQLMMSEELVTLELSNIFHMNNCRNSDKINLNNTIKSTPTSAVSLPPLYVAVLTKAEHQKRLHCQNPMEKNTKKECIKNTLWQKKKNTAKVET